MKYHDGSFLLENMDGKDGDYLFSETAETTVIGNIHDNPELLGERRRMHDIRTDRRDQALFHE